MSFVKAFVALSLLLTSVEAFRPSLHGRAHSNWRRHSTPRPRGTTYTLKDKFDSDNLLDEFEFWSSEDPTHGSVNYLDKDAATNKGLAYVDNGVVVLAVDDTNWVASGANRDSVRISSKSNYDNGLFIADFEAMPWGCSVWPAYWSNGPDWPAGGEIDVLEGVNEGTTNQYTLHTSDGCSASLGTEKVTATVGNAKCASANGDNAGCAYFDSDDRSYGKGFNKAGGGVYAHMIDSTGIKIWFFSRSDIPQDITDGNPDPSSWDSPAAFWATETCDTASHFYSQQLIIDTTLCGDWAGSSFNSDGCSGSCADTVADPSNFKNAKWRINSIKVYEAGGDGGSGSGSGSSSSSDAPTSTDWGVSASIGLTISGNANAAPTSSYVPTGTTPSSAAAPTGTATTDDEDDEDCDEEDDGEDADEGDDAEDCDDGDDTSATASSSADASSSTDTGKADSSNEGDSSDADCEDEDEGASASASGAAAVPSSTGSAEDDECDDEEDNGTATASGSAAAPSSTDSTDDGADDCDDEDEGAATLTGSAPASSSTDTTDDGSDDCDDEDEDAATVTGSAPASWSTDAIDDGSDDCDEEDGASYSAFPSGSASASAFPSSSGSAVPSASASASASGAAPSGSAATFYQPSGSASFAYSSASSFDPAATPSAECTESA
ncbi:concanavalin A-like lectin/glucanase domain-containing protein [Schizophyllum amplum]|uniref:Concanavalin A-like lectin/glucanase domain-containing protein n=1 Tax=Schizophyllum amplum TaxID=97359 RepID=A0A550CIT7_9AGAR|nr:concanavalin A-like lectin/glucanase domain-containing protein [Auriculariopsis ampla]